MSNAQGLALQATLIAAVLATAPAQAQDMPKRKPGLWEVAMQIEGAPAGMPTMKSQQCVDEKSDEAMQRRAMNGPDANAQCKQTALRRLPDGVEMEADCAGKDGKSHITARMTGDMQASYTVDSRVSFDPPQHGLSQARMTMKAHFAGACPAGMKPGEIRSAGGPGMAGGAPAMGIDVSKLQSMTPEQRKAWAEEMKKAMPAN